MYFISRFIDFQSPIFICFLLSCIRVTIKSIHIFLQNNATWIVLLHCVWISTVCVNECSSIVDDLCFVYMLLLSADNFRKCSKLHDYYFRKFSSICFIAEWIFFQAVWKVLSYPSENFVQRLLILSLPFQVVWIQRLCQTVKGLQRRLVFLFVHLHYLFITILELICWPDCGRINSSVNIFTYIL